mmetsp:Transcript_7409/g.15400  ORF Transcript_7409/g.15400 Transcript_7409/m.15400 type:complete len:209 (+) Transcript_7409:43-669(+)
MKVVYLVRHAESMENVQVYKFDRAMEAILECRPPRCSDLAAALWLLRCNVDAPLSPAGERQLADVRGQLQKGGFEENSGVQLVVHSTRQRALRTCRELFGAPGARFPTIALAEIVEHTPWDALTCRRRFRKRLRWFRSWLASRAEERIVVVGHGFFFEHLLAESSNPSPMANVEVRRCHFCPASRRFSEVEVLFQPQEEDSSDSGDGA